MVSRLGILIGVTVAQVINAGVTISEDPTGPPPQDAGFWDQVFDIGGKPVSLGQMDQILNSTRPNYYWADEPACTSEGGSCCPAYCCDVVSSAKDLERNKMDFSFKETQTATSPVDFKLLQWKEADDTGEFAGIIAHNLDRPVWGGWTIEIDFNKPVLGLRSYNAQVVGVGPAAKKYWLQPNFWNKDVQAGYQRFLVNGVTTATERDNNQLAATGTMYYSADATDPNDQQAVHVPEKRPVPVIPPVPGEKYNYADALQLSLLFYDAQRSGKLPGDNPIFWKANSAIKDGSDVKKDLSGGWYDAGDYIKLQVPMATSTVILLWGLIRYPDAFKSAGQLDKMRETIRWPLDYFIAAHTAPEELYVQVSDEVDHCLWEAAEDMTYPRRAYKVTCDNPGSQPVMDTAAALAAGSIAFKEVDLAYSNELLEHAVQLFDFAEKCPGDYIKNGTIPAATMYNDGGQFEDEHAYAAAWLHLATGDEAYLKKAQDLCNTCCSKAQQADQSSRVLHWGDVSAGVNLLLFEATKDQKYGDVVKSHVNNFMNNIPKTPKGLSYYSEWGANRYAANAAWTALVASDLGLDPDNFRKYGASQINYILGDCCIDPATQKSTESFMVGFGDAWPMSYHHRASTCNGTDCRCSSQPNVHTLWGAVIGGPEKDDTISRDGCPDFVHTEVSTSYNAGFTSSVAALKHLSLQGKHY